MEHTAPDLLTVYTPPPEPLPGFLAVYWAEGQPLRAWIDGGDPFPELQPDTSVTGADPGHALARRFVVQHLAWPDALYLAWADPLVGAGGRLMIAELITGTLTSIEASAGIPLRPYARADGRIYWREKPSGGSVYTIRRVDPAVGLPETVIAFSTAGGGSTLEAWHRHHFVAPSGSSMAVVDLDTAAVTSMARLGTGATPPIPTTAPPSAEYDPLPGIGSSAGGAGTYSGGRLRYSGESATGLYLVGTIPFSSGAADAAFDPFLPAHGRWNADGDALFVYPVPAYGTGKWFDPRLPATADTNAELSYMHSVSGIDGPGTEPHIVHPLGAPAPWSE